MKASQKITIGVVAAVLIGLVALAAPVLGGLVPTAPTAVEAGAATTEESTVAPPPTPKPTPTPKCVADSTGLFMFAEEPHYIVEPGDTHDSLEKRFCLRSGALGAGTLIEGTRIDIPYDGLIIEREADAADGCQSVGIIDPYSETLRGEVQDLGARPGANGTLSKDRSTYTVAPGDSLSGISDRVCVGRGGIGFTNEGSEDLQPGMVLILNPNP